MKKQQAQLIFRLLGKGGGGSNSGGNSGNNGGHNGNGSKGIDKVKNKDLDKEEREKKKEQAKAKKSYRQKGKYTNRGKHLGWYKNGKLQDQVVITNYLNDVSDPLTQVLMTYGEDGKYDAAYTYGLELIEVETA